MKHISTEVVFDFRKSPGLLNVTIRESSFLNVSGVVIYSAPSYIIDAGILSFDHCGAILRTETLEQGGSGGGKVIVSNVLVRQMEIIEMTGAFKFNDISEGIFQDIQIIDSVVRHVFDLSGTTAASLLYQSILLQSTIWEQVVTINPTSVNLTVIDFSVISSPYLFTGVSKVGFSLPKGTIGLFRNVTYVGNGGKIVAHQLIMELTCSRYFWKVCELKSIHVKLYLWRKCDGEDNAHSIVWYPVDGGLSHSREQFSYFPGGQHWYSNHT